MYMVISFLLLFISFMLLLGTIINQERNGKREYTVDIISGLFPGGMEYEDEIKGIENFIHWKTLVLTSMGVVLMIVSLITNLFV